MIWKSKRFKEHNKENIILYYNEEAWENGLTTQRKVQTIFYFKEKEILHGLCKENICIFSYYTSILKYKLMELLANYTDFL